MADKKYIIRNYPNGPNANKAVIAGKIGGIHIDWPEFKMGQDNKTPEFLHKNPLGKVPLLDTPEGPIFESNAIARYVARIGSAHAQLLGKDAYEEAIVSQWIDVVTGYVSPHMFPLFAFKYGFGAFSAEKHGAALTELKTVFGWFETHFTNHHHKFLVHDHISLADIVAACTLAGPLSISLDDEYRGHFPKVNDWLKRLFENEHVLSAFGGKFAFINKFEAPQ